MQDSLVSSSPEAVISRNGQAGEDVPSDLGLPVNFGCTLQLLGYELSTPAVAPGATVQLITLWQATDPEQFRPGDLADVGSEPVLFVHALDSTGTLVAQEDRLDAPAWDWREGDVIAQSHRIVLPSDLPQGLLNLEVGVYRRGDLTRLPVFVDDSRAVQAGSVGAIGDSIFLQPVRVQ
jgi:hypothetical protein